MSGAALLMELMSLVWPHQNWHNSLQHVMTLHIQFQFANQNCLHRITLDPGCTCTPTRTGTTHAPVATHLISPRAFIRFVLIIFAANCSLLSKRTHLFTILKAPLPRKQTEISTSGRLSFNNLVCYITSGEARTP